MNDRCKQILTIVLAAGVLFGVAAFQMISPVRQYSLSERRTLARPPKLSVEELASGKFIREFDIYAMDQFPLRDQFRSLKAYSARYLLGLRDNNGIYAMGNRLSKLEYPMKASMIDHAAARFRHIYDTYLSGGDGFGRNCRVYLSVIPDKNYFLAPLGGYPMLDYEALVDNLREQMAFASYIDIFDALSLEDYYETDPHWRQECLSDVAASLAEGMGAKLTDVFAEHALAAPFYGAYCGQSALRLRPDTIRYLTSGLLDACTVTSYDTGAPRQAAMYDMEKAAGRDPYEMFLSGSDALLVIENPEASTEKELVIFRDSFASSLAPLLVSGYRKITLVDLRYISGDMIGNFIDFKDQDVLFLYSTLILNNSLSLK